MVLFHGSSEEMRMEDDSSPDSVMDFGDTAPDDVEMSSPDEPDLEVSDVCSSDEESGSDGDDESNGVMSSDSEYLGEMDPNHVAPELRY